MASEERVHTIADMAEVLHDIFAVGTTHREVADASAILAVLHCIAVGERVFFARAGGVVSPSRRVTSSSTRGMEANRSVGIIVSLRVLCTQPHDNRLVHFDPQARPIWHSHKALFLVKWHRTQFFANHARGAVKFHHRLL